MSHFGLFGGSSSDNTNQQPTPTTISIPQPMTPNQLLSLGQLAWVDFRDTGYDGNFHPGQLTLERRGIWKVQLTDRSKSKYVWQGLLAQNKFEAYPPNSMILELPHNKFKHSIFANTKNGDMVEINKLGKSEGIWELAQVTSIVPPLIKVKFIDTGKTWWSHYLLTNEIRLSEANSGTNIHNNDNHNISNTNNFVNDRNNGNNRNTSQQTPQQTPTTQTNQSTFQNPNIDAQSEIVNIIKNCDDTNGSLDNIIRECAVQLGFDSKSSFIAHMFNYCKDSFSPHRCNKLYAVLTTSNTNGNNSNYNGNYNGNHDGNHGCCGHDHAGHAGHAGANTQYEDHDHDHADDTQQPEDIEMDGTDDHEDINNNLNNNHNANKPARKRRGGGMGGTSNKQNNNKHNGNNLNQQHQLQSQDMISREEEAQREQTVSVELLINSTKDVLYVLKEYSDRMVELKEYEKKRRKNGKQLSQLKQFSQNCNIKAVTSLQLFQLQFQGFKEKTIKRGLSEKTGVKNSNKVIDEFMADMVDQLIKKGKFDDNDIGFIMDRMQPFSKAMKTVLDGNRLPEFQQLTNVNFDENTANGVLSKVMGSTNHVIPQRVDNVRKNYKEYNMQHEMNIMNMKDDKKRRQHQFGNNEANNLYRDINHPMQKQRSKKEMERKAQQDLHRDRVVAWTHEPDPFDDM